jgi:flagellar hook-basal body complex protein FliE
MAIHASRSLAEGLLAKLMEQGQRSTVATGAPAVGGDSSGAASTQSKSFVDYLKDGVNEVASLQVHADRKAVEVATGRSGELHEAMLAATQAELGFNLMVQIRNKVIEAYQEVMRMPV